MAINDTDRFPPEPFISGTRDLIRNGLMQSDLDANHFKIINLDTANLIFDPIPSQVANPNNWFNSYDNGTHTFGFTQPGFSNISGQLSLTQQRAITRLGRIVEGEWIATTISASHLPPLNGILPPTNNVTLANNRITNLADPLDDQDAVTKRLFDQIASGLHPRAAVRCASVENMGLATLLHPVDGVTLQDNDRVLVKNQTGSSGYQHGIWLAHPGAWTRAPDCDTVAELVLVSVFVLEGDENANTTWFQVTPEPFFITPQPPPFPPFPAFDLLSSTAGSITPGAGLELIGTTLNVLGTAGRITVSSLGVNISSSYVGQTSLSVLGTIITGEWEGDVVAPEFGGTGVNNFASTITLAGNFSTSLGFAAPLGSPLNFALNGPTSLTLPILGIVATLNGNETFTQKHISADQIDSGVLLITVGGTSANNAIDALNNLLPDQTGHAGHVLTTDGAGKVSWVPLSSLP